MIDRGNSKENSTLTLDDACYNSGGGALTTCAAARVYHKDESVFHISGCAMKFKCEVCLSPTLARDFSKSEETMLQTLDFAIELANDLMDQKLRTYAERQNETTRKLIDSSRKTNHINNPTRSKM
ncbi:hypothetical protein Tco_0823818 [Tanacetum coccineum]|uniref:Uncharacterized protein n=1 Tax=Tanacetum coccineum TaxID=301880 RepID=A0ABQ5ANZ8_9ASTR